MHINKKRLAQDYKIEGFKYDLPESQIAKYPLEERDQSKLLVYKKNIISEDIYKNLDKHLSEDSILIFNNSKVIQARLNFVNSLGEHIEVFCLEPNKENPEPSQAMNKKSSVLWDCFVGRVKKWKESKIFLTSNNITLEAEIIERNSNIFTIKFSWEPLDFSFGEIISNIGEIPIPPYLKRKSEAIDTTRYQTVYANQEGSVAAPTAGLHFTEEIFEKLKSKNTKIDFVTLHVGAGTFKPVNSETLEDHDMHSEWIEVDKSLIENLIHQFKDKDTKKCIIAVGTTSMRTLETLYWMGIKANQNLNASIEALEVKQWDAYELNQELTSLDSLESLLKWLNKHQQEKLICKTQLLIVPFYELKIIDALITNFHQPSSTLLLLIASVVGDDWKKIYNHALQNEYRFLSYGDGSLLFKD